MPLNVVSSVQVLANDAGLTTKFGIHSMTLVISGGVLVETDECKERNGEENKAHSLILILGGATKTCLR